MKLFHYVKNKRKGFLEMFEDFFGIFKRTGETKKPRAIAFVDYENWLFPLKNFYGLEPDVIEWRKELESSYILQDMFVFGDFTNVSMKEELTKIRCATNSIIETQQGTEKYEKDMTDFVMLDYIYQSVNENADADIYIILSGDAHFQSVVKYLVQKCKKKVIVYGVRKAFSNQLKQIATEAIEIPASGQIINSLYPLIVENMEYVSGKDYIHPTFNATVRTLSDRHNISEEIFTVAINDMLEKGLLYMGRQRVEFNKTIPIIKANWEALAEAGLWEY